MKLVCVRVCKYLPLHAHYYKILFCEILKNQLGGGQEKKLPRLMVSINENGYFLLTEAVIKNRLVKPINRGGRTMTPVLKNAEA